MSKDNIISFKKAQERRKNNIVKKKYKQIVTINIMVSRDLKGDIKAECNCCEEGFSKEDLLEFLFNILRYISKEIPILKIKKEDSYKAYITVFYYQNIYDKKDIKFIFEPNNISTEKIAEYIFTFLTSYMYASDSYFI